ncbi:hypothetical protein CMO83_03080 [Candidatus Woesearchaeota archaeon]|jgi:hypothetical protein|nr:hypothetical protein [Candidatus Woesearchaeota archaeon]|tara:strand:- start:18906 stop:19169 length:264 start_codon:yes stop_codon:yes gene_type:complete
MKNTYVVAINARNDPTISEAVRKLFLRSKGRMHLDALRDGLIGKLGYNPLQLIRLGGMPLTNVEDAYRGNAYGVVDRIVYQKRRHPE